jgi:hypothetical protein
LASATRSSLTAAASGTAAATDGSYLVFKVFKPEDRWSMVDSVSHTDVNMQRRIHLLVAEAFNEEAQTQKYGETCNIICRDAALGHFEVHGCG